MNQSIIQRLRALVPPAHFMVWFLACLAVFVWFDIQWCSTTTWQIFKGGRGIYYTVYLMLPTAACLFAMPSALSLRGGANLLSFCYLHAFLRQI